MNSPDRGSTEGGAEPPGQSNSSQDSSRPHVRSAALVVVSAVCVLWLLLLATTALLTANPVTVNQDQLRRSQLLVVATVTTNTSGKIVIEDILLSRLAEERALAAGDSVSLANAHEIPLETGERYVLPLQYRVASSDWVITSSRLPNRVPLVYPARKATLDQVRELLETGSQTR